jgi:hypothetical protein
MIEVGRTAHELSARHGRYAFEYAEKQRLEAENGGQQDSAKFWRWVAASLEPRGGQG